MLYNSSVLRGRSSCSPSRQQCRGESSLRAALRPGLEQITKRCAVLSCRLCASQIHSMDLAQHSSIPNSHRNSAAPPVLSNLAASVVQPCNQNRECLPGRRTFQRQTMALSQRFSFHWEIVLFTLVLRIHELKTDTKVIRILKVQLDDCVDLESC